MANKKKKKQDKKTYVLEDIGIMSDIKIMTGK